ncbi:MAG: AMP-binding protein [Burkholderiaceae bacterium]|nr:AMP-binding protein [Burkholderiaceae bacterium]MEB2351654.1 AMP-binding protein [Burkholderiaceae bacterium]
MKHPYSHYPARAARQWPNLVAAIDGERQLSFAELDAQASGVAAALVARGLQVGERVAVIQHNSLEFVIAVIAIARAGGVLCPMLGALTEREQRYIAADSDARFVLALAPEHLGRARAIAPSPQQALGLGAFADAADLLAGADAAVTLPAFDRPPETLAQILYTSGTTGQPKGVTHSFASVSAAMNFWATTFGHRPEDRVLGQLPLSHFCARAMDSAWIGGAALVILRDPSPKPVIEAIARHRVAFMLGVPTFLRMLLDDPAIESADLSSLRNIVYAAAPAAPTLVERAIRRFGPVLNTGFGQTEAYGLCTYMGPAEHAQALAENPSRLTSVGHEFGSAQVMIRNEDGGPSAPGEVGEICICAPWMTPGFWKNPELDARRLKGGWLLTGDLGRMESDGYMYLADRKEDMIISGGYNVYPAEVEHALAAHPAVAESGVFAVPDDKWGEAVHASVVLRSGATISEADLIAFVKERVTYFKVPKKIHFVDALPKTPVGKIIRRVLREPYWTGHERQVHGAG